MFQFIPVRVLSLLALTSLLSGCLINPAVNEIMSANASGDYEKGIEIFERTWPKVEDADELIIGSVCRSYLSIQHYDGHRRCLEGYARKFGIPGEDGTNEFIYYQSMTDRALDLGDYDAVLYWGAKAEAMDFLYPVMVWEWIGTAHARMGNLDKSREYIDKIHNFKLEIFLGLVTLAETEVSRQRKASISRIYIAMGEGTNAEAEMAKPLAETSLSEYVLFGVMDTLEAYSMSMDTASERWVRRGVNAATAPPKKDEDAPVTDWDFGHRVLQASATARIAYQADALDQSEKIYTELLKEKNFRNLKSFYFNAIRDLADINLKQGDYGEAMGYATTAVAMVEQALPHLRDVDEQRAFMKSREDIYTILRGIYAKQGKRAALRADCSRLRRLTEHMPNSCSA